MSNFLNIATMAGGVAFFLFGMSILGNGLEKLSGGKMEKTLEKITNNIFKSLFLGMLVTAAIQSSSATTVIVVGLVNAGILKLRNAIGVIMGANIGTTVTSIILSFTEIGDIPGAGALLQLLKPKAFTPFIAVIGIIIFMTAKNGRRKMVGEIMLGFGILFNGMFIMTDAVEPLADSPLFQTLFSTLSNPILGILAGTIVTAIIQSSSASIGILQAVASTGAVRFSAALPIIMGQNIGTCVTAMLSAVGANKNARRAAMVHLSFNCIGTAVWLTLFGAARGVFHLQFLETPASLFGIAAAHTVFNLLCLLLMLPLSGVLEKLVTRMVPEEKQQEEYRELDERFFAAPSIALERCHRVTGSMAELAVESLKESIAALGNLTPELADSIRLKEEKTDYYEDILSTYLVKLSALQISASDSTEAAKLLKIIGDFERIADHAVNLLRAAEEMAEKERTFTDEARRELQVLCGAVEEILDLSLWAFLGQELEAAAMVEPLEEVIDRLKEEMRTRHIRRMQQGGCSITAGFVWSDLLTDLERTADHCSNIAGCVLDMADHSLSLHQTLRGVRNDSREFRERFREYAEKYSFGGMEEAVQPGYLLRADGNSSRGI